MDWPDAQSSGAFVGLVTIYSASQAWVHHVARNPRRVQTFFARERQGRKAVQADTKPPARSAAPLDSAPWALEALHVPLMKHLLATQLTRRPVHRWACD